MANFYVIKLINRDGTRGYVMDRPEGIIIIYDGFHHDVTQFKTYQDAQHFMRERKLERRGVKAYIRDNEDIIKENLSGVRTLRKGEEPWCIENNKGEHLFFDASKQEYYFDKRDVGYCFWRTEGEAKGAIEGLGLKEIATAKKLS